MFHQVRHRPAIPVHSILLLVEMPNLVHKSSGSIHSLMLALLALLSFLPVDLEQLHCRFHAIGYTDPIFAGIVQNGALGPLKTYLASLAFPQLTQIRPKLINHLTRAKERA
jgi:hypothetical protein